MEYPGYGIYKKQKCNEEKLIEDSKTLMNFLINNVGFEEKNIILIGRSIGSGIATFLASNYLKIGALILISAFTSIKGAVTDVAGTIASYMIKERF